MQAPEGWEQTYGELGRGLYGEAGDAGTRIHPTRTFLPGQTYEPEARALLAGPDIFTCRCPDAALREL